MSFLFMQCLNQNPASSLNQKGPFKPSSNIKGKTDSGPLAHGKAGVSRIYKLIRSNRASRTKFMASIVRKFDMPSWNDAIVPFLM